MHTQELHQQQNHGQGKTGDREHTQEGQALAIPEEGSSSTELTGKQLDARKPEDRAELLAILEKGLTHDPEDMDCLDYKAWLLKRDERIDEALAIYLKLEALPRHYLTVEQNLAEIYYKDLYKNADKALHYYRMMQERSGFGLNRANVSCAALDMRMQASVTCSIC